MRMAMQSEGMVRNDWRLGENGVLEPRHLPTRSGEPRTDPRSTAAAETDQGRVLDRCSDTTSDVYEGCGAPFRQRRLGSSEENLCAYAEGTYIQVFGECPRY